MNQQVLIDEVSRTYRYPDGFDLHFERVASISVSASGNHRLNLSDGSKAIVAPGWRCIEIVAEDWSV